MKITLDISKDMWNEISEYGHCLEHDGAVPRTIARLALDVLYHGLKSDFVRMAMNKPHYDYFEEAKKEHEEESARWRK